MDHPQTETPKPGVTVVALEDLVQLKNSVRGIKRPRGQSVRAPLHGSTQSAALGRGLDFSEVREYQSGDDVRSIDWKVTARSGRPHTKVFHEERERPFIIAVDLRANMNFATRVAFKSVIAARLAAMLAWSAASQRDRVGGLVFTGGSIKEVKPTTGSRGVTRLLQAIVSMQQQNTLQNEYRFAELFQHLRRSAHTGSSIVLLSDFFGCDTSDGKAARQMAEHNHVIACRLYDPLEKQLPPPALYAITNGVEASVIDTASEGICRQYESMFATQSQQLANLFTSRTSSYLECATTERLEGIARDILRRLPGSHT